MSHTEKMIRWLRSYPMWEDVQLDVDHTDVQPPSAGLYPKGVQVLARKEDIQGNCALHCRQSFLLQKKVFGQHNCPENADWLLDFQNWVQRQSALGLAPRFGDMSEKEHICAQNGMCKSVAQTGTSLYTVEITAQYWKNNLMEE